MTSRITVGCPACDQKMTVDTPQVPSKITCPKCQQPILMTPGKPPQSPAADYEDFDALPPMSVVSAPVTRPVSNPRILERAARKAHAAANPAEIQTKRRHQRKRLFQVLSCVLALGTVGTLAFVYVREIPTESWAAMMPGAETPANMLQEYAAICESFHGTCETIDSEYSRNRAIQKISVMTARLRGFPDRVTELGTPSPVQREVLDPMWIEQIEGLSEQSRDHVNTLRGKRKLLSGKFLAALQQHLNAMDAAANSMITAWRQP